MDSYIRSSFGIVELNGNKFIQEFSNIERGVLTLIGIFSG